MRSDSHYDAARLASLLVTGVLTGAQHDSDTIAPEDAPDLPRDEE